MPNILKKLPDYWKIIVTIAFIFGLGVTSNLIFAKNTDLLALRQEFQNYKEYDRLQYIDKRITILEDRRKCEGRSCREKMTESEWEEYREKLREKELLEKELQK